MVILNHATKEVFLMKDGVEFENYFVKKVLTTCIYNINKSNKFEIQDLIEEETNLKFFKKHFEWKSQLEFISDKMMEIKLNQKFYQEYKFYTKDGVISKDFVLQKVQQNLNYLRICKPSRADVENTFALTCS